MRNIMIALMTLIAAALVGCKGGSGGTSTGGTYLTHAQIAADFVYRLNLDAGYDVELVKTQTDQYDYIVVYDYDYGTYDAYYIGAYSPGQNIVNYLNNYDWDFFYDLIPLTGNYYEDPITGIIFEKTSGNSKNRSKLAAIEEGLKKNKAADLLVAEYGFEANRAQEVATLVMSYQKTPVERRSDAMVDGMFAEITNGHTYTDFTKASKLEQTKMLMDTIQHNGILPEQANKLIREEIGIDM